MIVTFVEVGVASIWEVPGGVAMAITFGTKESKSEVHDLLQVTTYRIL